MRDDSVSGERKGVISQSMMESSNPPYKSIIYISLSRSSKYNHDALRHMLIITFVFVFSPLPQN